MTGRRKVPLSIQQHRDLGIRLARIRDELVEIDCQLRNAYGIKASAANKVRSAGVLLDAQRSIMENLVFRDYSEAEGASIALYYPAPELRKRKT